MNSVSLIVDIEYLTTEVNDKTQSKTHSTFTRIYTIHTTLHTYKTSVSHIVNMRRVNSHR